MRKRFRPWLRRFRYRYFRYVGRTLSLGPPLAGVLIALLLGLPAQMSEIYLSLFEGGLFLGLVRGLIGLSCLALLSCLLYYWHLLRSTPQIGEIYEEYPDLNLDRNLLRVRNVKAACCALLPILGLLYGLAEAYQLADKTCTNLTGALDRLNWQTNLGSDCATPLRIARLASIKLFLVAALIVGSTILLIWAIRKLRLTGRMYDAGRRKWAIRCLIASASVLAFAAVAGPILAPSNQSVSIAWLVGPAVAILIVLTSAVTILMGLSWLSRRIHFPITSTFLALGVVMAASGIKGNVSAPTGPGLGTAPTAESSDDKAQLRVQFIEWLKKRRVNGDEHYPVFIFAAEGGGIYAASGIALFLAALQDQCPQFAEHIFAISAVSGGAVGATAFHALLDQPTSRACRALDPNSQGKTTSDLERILRADHLSPIAALILPDTLGKVVPLVRDRAGALEWSLVCAFENRQLHPDAIALCPRSFPGSRLLEPFEGHWRDGASPALVLNSTWVETGFRVAFAPKDMPLKGVGDGTLYGFSDLPAPPVKNLTLVSAAVASARFPLIAPPWTLRHTGTRVWNFVDGGYADNSGSTTALEIYKALEETARISKADLYFIILTDAVAAPDPANINGSGFSDTMAPISALLNVRAQLASRAVTQAVDHFKIGDPKELVARSGNSRLLVARLEQRSVPLTLGWKISRTEIDLVRLMLGKPELCRPEAPKPVDDIAATTATIIDNSCIKKKIVDLLSERKAVHN